MALTLIEALKTATPREAVYIEEYAASSAVLAVIPFRTVPGGSLPYNREDTLPNIGFRGVNEAYIEGTGIINPQVEVCKIAGGDLDVDRYIIDTQGEGVRSAHELMKVKSLAHSWTRNFIKGDSISNPRVFDGLQVRLTGSQLIGNANAGAALSLLKLDQLIDQVTNPTHLIMSKDMRRLLTAASRATGITGFIQWEKNTLGQQIARYADLPICEVYQDNTDADILPFTETSPDGTTSTACASIYCVSFGDMMVEGIQGSVNGQPGISVRDLGELETKPVMRTRVDWYTSIAIMHGRGAARLSGILNAAVTA